MSFLLLLECGPQPSDCTGGILSLVCWSEMISRILLLKILYFRNPNVSKKLRNYRNLYTEIFPLFGSQSKITYPRMEGGRLFCVPGDKNITKSKMETQHFSFILYLEYTFTSSIVNIIIGKEYNQKQHFLNVKIKKKTKDLKFVSTNTLVSFLRPFSKYTFILWKWSQERDWNISRNKF